MVSTLQTAPKAGDVVEILWGVDTVEGRVTAVYSTGLGVRLVVEVPVLGPSGEALDYTSVTVPLSALV